MSTTPSAVPRSLRVGSFVLSVVLMYLFIWLLGFVLADIGNLTGPSWSVVRAAHEAPADRARADQIAAEIAEIEQLVHRQGQLQQDLRSSTNNARGTMQQIMELQRLALQQGTAASEADAETLSVAQQRFLQAQERFEQANAEITDSNAALFELRRARDAVQETLEQQADVGREEYERLRRAHQLKVATWKLSFIVPVFLLSAGLFSRHRAGAYRAILLAALAASFWKVGRVMHAYFPEEYFKYIAIVAAIGIVLAFLVWLLRKTAHPGRDLLLTRYREAYRAHMCPVCSFPIARGPLRFAVWTRKGPRPAAPGAERASSKEQDAGGPYACPSCGTSLFADCGSCGSLRHTLLPYCERCGDERVDGPLASAV